MLIANVLQPLIDACRAILEFWHDALGDFEGSWGWAIILLTFTVRLAILPLTFKGVKSMQRLQQLQPEIKRIQERFKEDKQRMNQEIMAFYQREKVNPLGSCLPLLLQFPFFIALFSLLRSDEFKADIANNHSFGFIPNLAANPKGGVLVALLVLYVVTMLGSSAVTAISADPTQRRIAFILPLVFVPVVINFPSGLLVYWITTNVWTVGQQLLVRKLYPKPEPKAPPEDEAGKPARGKPPSPAPAARNGEGARGAARAAAGDQSDGRSTKAPPRSPRKKKKRSGRRR